MPETQTYTDGSGLQRLRVIIRGAVQGVGFRPFIYRLANECSLTGWVINNGEGVVIETDGPTEVLERFLTRIGQELPPRAFIQSMESSYLDPGGFTSFQIRESAGGGSAIAVILPDIAPCPECLAECFDPGNRRYLYPFINCTNCGPRYSIIEALPYDRPNTTMKEFRMCPRCLEEYRDPGNRRFHAQPNACPECGPQVELLLPDGKKTASAHDAMIRAAKMLKAGYIVAVKGIGGYHLMADARNRGTVDRLRHRKHREEKPFALLYPSIEMIRRDCYTGNSEERILRSPEAPIILLRRKSAADVADAVAEGNPNFGIMLPPSPLHYILTRELGIPVVATSGNRSDEPICIDNHEALKRLHGIADAFLTHNRPIRRHVDDSIVRIVAGREMVMRRARGYAPLPVPVAAVPDKPVIAFGAHLKNTVAVTAGHNVVISQHIGDLETEEAYEAFQTVAGNLAALYGIKEPIAACDLHPNYLSTKFARGKFADVRGIQHHYAHIASCMAENQIGGPVLGAAWDGTGLGTDDTIWGGEFLSVDGTGFIRAATLRRFRLPGGERAVREPRRTAIGLLYEILGESLFRREDILPVRTCTTNERRSFLQMLAHGINSPVTTSAGRLFDAIASIIGLRHRISFEGQAAMELEYCAGDITDPEPYPFEIGVPAVSGGSGQLQIIDWSPMILAILEDASRSTDKAMISARFHATCAAMIAAVARRNGIEKVVLSGGCFQNARLTESSIRALRASGFRPYWHQRVPTNDGGIALGQISAVNGFPER